MLMQDEQESEFVIDDWFQDEYKICSPEHDLLKTLKFKRLATRRIKGILYRTNVKGVCFINREKDGLDKRNCPFKEGLELVVHTVTRTYILVFTTAGRGRFRHLAIYGARVPDLKPTNHVIRLSDLDEIIERG